MKLYRTFLIGDLGLRTTEPVLFGAVGPSHASQTAQYILRGHMLENGMEKCVGIIQSSELGWSNITCVRITKDRVTYEDLLRSGA